MKESEDLYQIAEKEDILIIPFHLPETGSVSIQSENGKYYIGIDDNILDSEPERKVHLGHELGHCITGSFYNHHATCDIRQKHENKANKWVIETFIKAEELDKAVAEGHTEIWDLADYFCVTETFMKMAICWYTHGNLATDLYL